MKKHIYTLTAVFVILLTGCETVEITRPTSEKEDTVFEESGPTGGIGVLIGSFSFEDTLEHTCRFALALTGDSSVIYSV